MDGTLKIDCIIGVDPGANGGIAVHIPGTGTRVLKMPKAGDDLFDFFCYYSSNYNPMVFLEKLSMRRDDLYMKGDKASMGKAFRIQNMMANYEHLKAIIEASHIPFVMVHPMTWQSKLQLRQRGVDEDKAHRKKRYQAKSAELYPEIKVTLWNADALLLMHFGIWALEHDRKWLKANLPDKHHEKLLF